MLVFVDTNIFVYAAGSEHPLKAPCIRFLDSLIRENYKATTSTEVLQEILYIYDRRNHRAKAIKLVISISRLFPFILPVTLDDIIVSAEMMRKYSNLSPRDAVHSATMINNDIERIVSADKDFDIVSEIIRIDPLK